MKLKNFKLKYYINYIVITALLVVFTTMTFTGGMTPSLQYLLEKMAIAMILAASLSMVVGFLGELSLGHAGFMCVGAYIGGKVASILVENGVGGKDNIWIFLLAAFAGGAAAAVCGFLIGMPALRLKGDYLAIVTLAFGEIVKSLFINSSEKTFGGAIGLTTPRFDRKYLFIIAFVLLLATLAVLQNLIRSKHGRAITAIRDSEIAAHATGVNVTKYKLLVFIISAFFAGLAGVLYSYSNYNLQAVKFGFNYSIEILVMVVLGGMGSMNGSLIAASLITYLNIKLATVLTGDLAVLQNMIYALILIIVVIFGNAPALRSFREKYNFKAIFGKIFRKKPNPATERNDEGSWDRIPTKIKMDELLSVDVKSTESVQDPDKGEN